MAAKGGGAGGSGPGPEPEEAPVLLRKGPWMPEEDEILVDYVNQYGPRDWSSIRSKGLLPRTGKSCRLRWVNKLKPDLKSGCKFSPEEEKLVVEMQAKLGNKWAKIASYLPGRTDNDVKNFWSTRQKRLLRALQRPKGTDSTSCNGGTMYGSDGMDHIDHLGNTHCFNDFAFQVHTSPTRGYTNNNNNNNNEVDQLYIRGQPVSDLRRLRHPGGGYNIANNKPATLSTAHGNNTLACSDHHHHHHHHHHNHNDLFMVKLNDLVPNEAVQGAAFMDTSSAFQHDNNSSTSSPMDHNNGDSSSSSKCAAAAAAAAMVSKSLRSVKNRRPRYTRPRIDNNNNNDSAGLGMGMGIGQFDRNNNSGSHMVDQKSSLDHMQLLHLNGDRPSGGEIGAESENNIQHLMFRQHDLYGGELPTGSAGAGSASDYLSDFLMMHYDSCCSTVPTTASTSSTGGRPDSPLVGFCPPPGIEIGMGPGPDDNLVGCFAALSQWDKLPLLTSSLISSSDVHHDTSTTLGGAPCDTNNTTTTTTTTNDTNTTSTSALLHMNMNIKEEAMDSITTTSCTPDSVLVSFPSDVFDSLEPLSPSSSEWWQR